MAWQGIKGHDEIREWFCRALKRGRLGSTFMFLGPEGVGKRLFALKLAQSLFCREVPPERLDPCGRCPACAQTQAQTHPDLYVVARPEGKSTLPLELLVGDKEHRMQEGLCHFVSLKPFEARFRVGIVDDADYMTLEAANSLLKTLEEPPPHSLLILISSSAARQLPTIRSRCQIIRFRPLPEEIVREIVIELGIATDEAEAERLALFSEGSVARAKELAGAEYWEFCNEFLPRLADWPMHIIQLGNMIADFAGRKDTAGAERRSRLHSVLGFAAGFYRALLRTLEGAPAPVDPLVGQAVERAVRSRRFSWRLVLRILERTMEAAEQIDRNVHPTIVIDNWLWDIARMQMAAIG